MRQLYEYHPVVGFRFVPGLRARVPHEGGGYLVRTNSSGFRDDREFLVDKPAGTRRILVFGDSFTAGEGVSNGKRWTDALERLVPGLEVCNFGLPATGTDQHYLIYKEFAKGIDHDLLVIAVFVENIRRVGSRYRWFTDQDGKPVLYAKPYFELDNGQLALRAVPPPRDPIDPASLRDDERATIAATARHPRLKAAFKKLRNSPAFERAIVATGLKDRAMRFVKYQPIPEYDDPNNPAWLVMRAVIREWIAAHPRPVAVVPIPLYHHVEGLARADSYRARLHEAAHSAGGVLIDPLPTLAAHDAATRRGFYYPHDGHLTAEGNQALARALEPGLGAALESPRKAGA